MSNKYIQQAKEARRKRKWMNRCGRKKRFDSEDDARYFNNKEAVAYYCNSCGFWHRSEAINRIIGISRKRKK